MVKSMSPLTIMDRMEISASDENIIHHPDITRRVSPFWVAGEVGHCSGPVRPRKILNRLRKSLTCGGLGPHTLGLKLVCTIEA